MCVWHFLNDMYERVKVAVSGMQFRNNASTFHCVAFSWLTHLRPKCPSHRNQLIDRRWSLFDWFLEDGNIARKLVVHITHGASRVPHATTSFLNLASIMSGR